MIGFPNDGETETDCQTYRRNYSYITVIIPTNASIYYSHIILCSTYLPTTLARRKHVKSVETAWPRNNVGQF